MEVIANVASFVAGANDFAGLAAMSATSHLMRAELKSIFFETVIWNQSFQARLNGSLDELDAPEFRYIRYASNRKQCVRQLI